MAAAQEQIKIDAQATPKKKPRFDHPFTTLGVFKVAVVIQQKGGNIIKGRVKWFRNGFLKLTDAEVIGLNRQVKTAWLLVDHNTVAHLHPDPDVPALTDEDLKAQREAK